jgi:putative membrane protein
MIKLDDTFSQRVEATVAGIEQRTDAEIVVVAAARSSSYAELRERAATLACLAVLAVILWIPHPIAEPWVLLDLCLTWLGARWIMGFPTLTRALTTAARRQTEVRAAAERAFHQEAVHGTPGRTGVLVYVSALEGLVEVLPDLGVEGAVPGGELLQALDKLRHDDLDHLIAGLEDLGDVLAAHLPHHEGSDAVNLPNTPRIKP